MPVGRASRSHHGAFGRNLHTTSAMLRSQYEIQGCGPLRKAIHAQSRLRSIAAALFLQQSIQLSAQPPSGLSFSPAIEAGYFHYLISPRHKGTLTGSGLPWGIGGNLGFRFLRVLSIDLTLLIGFRSYEEQFTSYGVRYELTHKYVDFIRKLQFSQILHSKDRRFWELGYGMTLCGASDGGISLSTADGHTGYHSGPDPPGFGFTSSLVRGWGSSRPVRLGFTASFIIVVPGEFEVPWPNETDPPHAQRISLGQPRIFVGLTCSVGLLHLSWPQPNKP